MIYILRLFGYIGELIIFSFVLLINVLLWILYMLYWFKLISWGNFIIYTINKKHEAEYIRYGVLPVMIKILGRRPKEPAEVETFWFTCKRLFYHREMYDWYY